MSSRTRAVEALMAGEPVENPRQASRNASVAEFVTELRTAADTTAPPAANAVLATILEHGRTPHPVHVVTADEAIEQRGAPYAAAGAAAMGDRARRWLRSIAVPTAAGVVLFGGLAGAGALPAPLQHAAARAAAHLGVTLPDDTAPARVPARVHLTETNHEAHPSTPSATAAANGHTKTATATTVAGSSHSGASRHHATGTNGTTSSLTVTPPKVAPPRLPQLTVPTLPLPPTPQVTVPLLP